ncbi:BON domain-containing protein, partial [Citrobacter braakii]|nr:BON domain-containing protein [Citrobacter braakii]
VDIKVETNKGVVSLSGNVKSDAERDLAIETAKGIKGVKAVSADGLKSVE